MRTLVCPDPRHWQERPLRTTAQASRTAGAKILEGMCPACDGERLERQGKNGRCPCCGGLFWASGNAQVMSYAIQRPPGCRLEEREVDQARMTV